MLRFGVIVILASVVTIPIVVFIPRARQSPLFDRVLWSATWVLAIIGAWMLPDLVGVDFPLNSFVIAQMPILSMGLGAIAGALSLNVLLWLMDRFSSPAIEEEDPDAPGADVPPAHSDDLNPPQL